MPRVTLPPPIQQLGQSSSFPTHKLQKLRQTKRLEVTTTNSRDQKITQKAIPSF